MALTSGDSVDDIHVTTSTQKETRPANSLIDTVVALESANSSQVKGFVYFKTRGDAIDCGRLMSILDSKNVQESAGKTAQSVVNVTFN